MNIAASGPIVRDKMSNAIIDSRSWCIYVYTLEKNHTSVHMRDVIKGKAT